VKHRIMITVAALISCMLIGAAIGIGAIFFFLVTF
jgi:hypothetical protein